MKLPSFHLAHILLGGVLFRYVWLLLVKMPTMSSGLMCQFSAALGSPTTVITEATITSLNAPTTSSSTKTFGTLCPHYCLLTHTSPTPSCTSQPCLLPAYIRTTVTEYCKWCPTLSCVVPLRTTTVPGTCSGSFACPPTFTLTAPCPEKTWPTGYVITAG